jgi:transcriptional regulator with XRE-family HTH domain
MEKSIHSANHQCLVRLLRQIRLGSGLKQVDIATRLRKPQSFVSKYEAGERRLDILELREVCHAIGLTLPEFATRLESQLQ